MVEQGSKSCTLKTHGLRLALVAVIGQAGSSMWDSFWGSCVVWETAAWSAYSSYFVSPVGQACKADGILGLNFGGELL